MMGGMKIILLLLPLLMLSACRHSRSADIRRTVPLYTMKADTHRYRTDNSRRKTHRRNTRQPRRHPHRGDSGRNSVPPLPLKAQGTMPIGMRWNCPNEPQMLGYAAR